MTYTIVNKSRPAVLAQKARLADTIFSRIKGLMFRKSMDPDEALLFYHTHSIHTFCMRFPIDVVFLDKNMKVIKVYHALKPARLAGSLWSFLTIELPANKVFEDSLKIGDILELIPNKA